jgi:hypothetical protein
MIKKVFSGMISDFARILALCRAQGITIPTIGLGGAIECKLPKSIVGIVIPRARHSAKNRAKKGYFTSYRVLKGCVKHYTVCARTVRSVRPSDIFPKKNRFHSELADIYISSNKFVMNGAISMEVRFNTFPLIF